MADCCAADPAPLPEKSDPGNAPVGSMQSDAQQYNSKQADVNQQAAAKGQVVNDSPKPAPPPAPPAAHDAPAVSAPQGKTAAPAENPSAIQPPNVAAPKAAPATPNPSGGGASAAAQAAISGDVKQELEKAPHDPSKLQIDAGVKNLVTSAKELMSQAPPPGPAPASTVSKVPIIGGDLDKMTGDFSNNPYKDFNGPYAKWAQLLAPIRDFLTGFNGIVGKIGMVVSVIGLIITLTGIGAPAGAAIELIGNILTVAGLVIDALCLVLSSVLEGLAIAMLAKETDPLKRKALAAKVKEEASNTAGALISVVMQLPIVNKVVELGLGKIAGLLKTVTKDVGSAITEAVGPMAKKLFAKIEKSATGGKVLDKLMTGAEKGSKKLTALREGVNSKLEKGAFSKARQKSAREMNEKLTKKTPTSGLGEKLEGKSNQLDYMHDKKMAEMRGKIRDKVQGGGPQNTAAPKAAAPKAPAAKPNDSSLNDPNATQGAANSAADPKAPATDPKASSTDPKAPATDPKASSTDPNAAAPAANNAPPSAAGSTPSGATPATPPAANKSIGDRWEAVKKEQSEGIEKANNPEWAEKDAASKEADEQKETAERERNDSERQVKALEDKKKQLESKQTILRDEDDLNEIRFNEKELNAAKAGQQNADAKFRTAETKADGAARELREDDHSAAKRAEERVENKYDPRKNPIDPKSAEYKGTDEWKDAKKYKPESALGQGAELIQQGFETYSALSGNEHKQPGALDTVEGNPLAMELPSKDDVADKQKEMQAEKEGEGGGDGESEFAAHQLAAVNAPPIPILESKGSTSQEVNGLLADVNPESEGESAQASQPQNAGGPTSEPPAEGGSAAGADAPAASAAPAQNQDDKGGDDTAVGAVPYWPSLIDKLNDDLTQLGEAEGDLGKYKQAQQAAFAQAGGVMASADQISQQSKQGAEQAKQNQKQASGEGGALDDGAGKAKSVSKEGDKAGDAKSKGSAAQSQASGVGSTQVDDGKSDAEKTGFPWNIPPLSLEIQLLKYLKDKIVAGLAAAMQWLQNGITSLVMWIIGVKPEQVKELTDCKAGKAQEGAAMSQTAAGDSGAAAAQHEESANKAEGSKSEAQQYQQQALANISAADQLLAAVVQLKGDVQKQIQAGNKYMQDLSAQTDQEKAKQEAKNKEQQEKQGAGDKDEAGQGAQPPQGAQQENAKGKDEAKDEKKKDRADAKQIDRVKRAAAMVHSADSDHGQSLQIAQGQARSMIAESAENPQAVQEATATFEQSASGIVGKFQSASGARMSKMEGIGTNGEMTTAQLGEAISDVRAAAAESDQTFADAASQIQTDFQESYMVAHQRFAPKKQETTSQVASVLTLGASRLIGTQKAGE